MFKCVSPSVNDFVKVMPDRMCPGMWQITKVDGRVAEIVKVGSKEKERFYVALLFKDFECMKMQREWKVARAAKIGTNIRRK